MIRLALLLFCLWTVPAWADWQLQPSYPQGSLAVGQVPPGSVVSIDGKRVRVAADGLFLLAVGRDAKGPLTVAVRPPGGGETTRRIAVTPRRFKIQRIDGLPPKKVTPPPELIKRIVADAALIKAVRRLDSPHTDFRDGFIWPLRGRISGVFGSQRILNGKPRSPHRGVDIAAPTGTPFGAAAAGIVVLVHEDMFYSGKTVMIDHGHGLSSVYVHMNEIHVREGQRVAQGTVIGTVGQTGRATGPHLHWGVSLFSTHVDPEMLVGPMEATQ